MADHVIDRLGHQGDGIAAGPIYAARTLPGEVITGEAAGDRIAAPRILTPSPHRVAAPCAHYRGCGGCQVMHASDAFVADWKQDVVREALSAQGLPAPIRGITTSPPRSRRRATLSARRTKSGAMVGFHGPRSDTIVPIRDCLVLSPALQNCLPAIADITSRAASRKGELGFALTETETGVDCAVSGGRPLDPALSLALPRFAGTFARLTWGDEVVFVDPPPRVSFGKAGVTPPPGAFLQATKQGEAALLASVAAALDGATRILDLFAGCGTFCLPLAERIPVHAVEGDGDLLVALDHGARNCPGLKPVTTETRDLFRRPLMPDELAPFDGAVVDPPRAGAAAQIAELARAEIPRIAMVSCNPVSFARDAATLVRAGYRIDWIDVIDQFRWTAHVELAAALSLPHIAANA